MNDYYVSVNRDHATNDALGTSTLSRQQYDKSFISNDETGDYTEVFSWGSDRHGQLGLGKSVSSGKQYHMIPRFCSYNICISQISCGTSHSVFITNTNLVYSMGNNVTGQLGVGDPQTSTKTSPVLIESLIGLYPVKVSCGSNHTLVGIKCGQVYSWGNNEFGQCGCGEDPLRHPVYWQPQRLVFDEKLKPFIEEINAGAYHSCFIDDQGRLFTCGRGDQGQLGTGYQQNETFPRHINNPPLRLKQVQGGEDHTVLLTIEGEVFVMGSNLRGQLGLGSNLKHINTPAILLELSQIKIVKIRTGQFSGALSRDNQLYVWGSSIFGEFFTPHRVKSVNTIDIDDFQIGRSGFIAILTNKGQVFSWGQNEYGQLGQGDMVKRTSPHLIDPLANKKVTQIALGQDFVIALGQTLPMSEQQKQPRTSRKEHLTDSLPSNPQPNSNISRGKYETLNYSHLDKPKESSNSKISYRSKQKESSKKGLNKTINNITRDEKQSYTPLRSSPERLKSQPKKKIKSKKAVIEPDLYKAPSAIHENVVTTLRREKDTASLQLHHERNARRILESENEQLRRQLEKVEQDVKELYDLKHFYMADKEKSEQQFQQDYYHLKGVNQKLITENDDLKKQTYEIDIQSRESINRYQILQNDYEKLRNELDIQLKKNDDISKDLWRNVDQRKKLENELKSLESDLDAYKANVNDQGSQNLREIGLLRTQCADLKYQIEDLMGQLKMKNGDTEKLNQEIYSWQEVVDRLNKENTELKSVQAELEHKNHQLLHRIDEQLNQRATEYKERILQTITKSESPTKLNTILKKRDSDKRLQTILQEERNHPRDTLRQHSNTRQHAASQFDIRKELDKIEQYGQNPHVKPSNTSTIDHYHYQPPIQVYPQGDYSPLRQKGFTSPENRFGGSINKSREEIADEKLRKMRQSCEKIATVLGVNASMSPIHPNRPITYYPQTQTQEKTPNKYISPSRAENSGKDFYQTTFGETNNGTTPSTSYPLSNYASNMAAHKVRQSLQEIRQKVDAIRREKEAVEHSLNAYEDRQHRDQTEGQQQ